MDPFMNATLRARQYAVLGLELPADVTRLLAIAQAAGDAATADPALGLNLDELTADNVAEALREAAVTRAVKEGMQQLLGELNNGLGRRINLLLADDLDRAATALRPGFVEAAAVVTDAIAKGLTGEVYGDAQQVIKAGPAASSMYHATTDALEHLNAVRGFLRPAMPLGNEAATVVTLTSAAGPGTFANAQGIFSGGGGNERFLEMYALPGIKPALNTAKQARAVLAGVANAHQARQASDEAERVAANKERAEAWARLGQVPGITLAD